MSTALLALAFFLVALLYGAVGNAGATGFLAALALAGVPIDVAKPTALLANVLVAGVATATFHRAGLVPFRAVGRFVVGSVPAAFVGGLIPGAHPVARVLAAAVLVIAAGGMLARRTTPATDEAATAAPSPPWIPSVALGALVGLLAGTTGTGGGVILGPILTGLGWTTPRQAAGITAPFILANTVAGFGGAWTMAGRIGPEQVGLALVAAAGGLVGARIGASALSDRVLRYLLAAVLAVAAVRIAMS